MTPGSKKLSPGLKKLAVVLAVAAMAGAAMTARAEATPQFAVVGQSLGHGAPQAEPVTYYYNRYWRGYGGYRSYRPYGYSNRYAQPYYGRRQPYYSYRRYGYGYRKPFFYFRFGR